MSEQKENIITRAIGLIDLTNLNDDCTPHDIEALCDQAMTPAGPVAAVCVWPKFVAQSKRLLGEGPIKVATVVNFPAGGEDIKATMHETKDCVANGADEIDLVMPYRAFAAGNVDLARTMIHTIRATTDGSALLKVILETGELRDPALIAGAAKLALEEGADFIKTSTGKESVNATLPGSLTMIRAIRAYHARTGIRIGYKPAGGISKAKDALVYLSLMKDELGDRWLRPDLFRFGASSLLGDIERQLEHHVTGAYSSAWRHPLG